MRFQIAACRPGPPTPEAPLGLREAGGSLVARSAAASRKSSHRSPERRSLEALPRGTAATVRSQPDASGGGLGSVASGQVAERGHRVGDAGGAPCPSRSAGAFPSRKRPAAGWTRSSPKPSADGLGRCIGADGCPISRLDKPGPATMRQADAVPRRRNQPDDRPRHRTPPPSSPAALRRRGRSARP